MRIKHDSKIRLRDDIKRIIFKFGMAGYGVFWAIQEDIKNNGMIHADYDKLSAEYGLSPESIEALIESSNQFVFEGSYISTPTVEVEVKSSIEELTNKRRKEFGETLASFLPTYGKDMLNDFYRYWTEMNPSRSKFRAEMEKTWELSRRLQTWASRNKVTTQTTTKAPLKTPTLLDPKTYESI